jgi:hypothetical protein
MKTELVRLDALLLGGVSFYGDPFTQKGGWDAENEIGRTCSRFAEFLTEHPDCPYFTNKTSFYEIHIYGKDTLSKGYFEVFAGQEVTTPHLPVSLTLKHIAAADYLKVTLRGSEITGDWWQALENELLPQYGVTRNTEYIIQAYDERFKGTDRICESEMDAYIPVYLV